MRISELEEELQGDPFFYLLDMFGEFEAIKHGISLEEVRSLQDAQRLDYPSAKVRLIGDRSGNVVKPGQVISTVYFDIDYKEDDEFKKRVVGAVVPGVRNVNLVRISDIGFPDEEEKEGFRYYGTDKAEQLPRGQNPGTCGPWLEDPDEVFRVIFQRGKKDAVGEWCFPGRHDISMLVPYKEVYDRLSQHFTGVYEMVNIVDAF